MSGKLVIINFKGDPIKKAQLSSDPINLTIFFNDENEKVLMSLKECKLGQFRRNL